MSIENPYAAPASRVADLAGPRVPEEVAKQIRNAWLAATLSGVLTLVIVAVAMSSGEAVMGIDAWSLIDVGLMLGLAYGIYRKSRACAVIMLVYFLLSKILMMIEAGRPTGLLMAAIFAYFYFQGVQGTYAYHRLKTT